MEAKASAKYLRGSAQKARLVIDTIRGKNVSEALAILRFTQKRAATGIEKCVRSAVANATEAAERANIAVDPDELWVKAAMVDVGPTKNRSRVRPAPQGRAFRERRHFCHVSVVVSNDERADAKANGKGSRGAKATSKRSATRTGSTAAKTATKTTKQSATTDVKKTVDESSQQHQEAAE